MKKVAHVLVFLSALFVYLFVYIHSIIFEDALCLTIIMVRRKSNLGPRSRDSQRVRNKRANLSPAQIAQRNEATRIRNAARRAKETTEEREQRLAQLRHFVRNRRRNKISNKKLHLFNNQNSGETTPTDALVKQKRSEKILKAKELYSQGSRNFLLKSYADAVDELSQACVLYKELYGELSPELRMPYLLYAKSLIALAIDENAAATKNDVKKVKSPNEADSTTDGSSDKVVDEKPSISNGEAAESSDTDTQEDDEENEAICNLQLAGEILELAAEIFSRHGQSGLSNLAEVRTKNNMDAARKDCEKALKTCKDLPKNDHRVIDGNEIGHKYLMQQLNNEGAASLKEACDLIEAVITDIKSKEELTDKDMNSIQDMEETKQEILAKIGEIEETQAQNIAEIRSALDSYIKPIFPQNAEGAGTIASSSCSTSTAGSRMALKTTEASSSTSSITSSSKPLDIISHLTKHKKCENRSSEVKASPVKRTAV